MGIFESLAAAEALRRKKLTEERKEAVAELKAGQ